MGPYENARWSQQTSTFDDAPYWAGGANPITRIIARASQGIDLLQVRAAIWVM